MYEKKILDAIQMLVDNAVDKASFDKTIKGTISKCVDRQNGKYVVIYQDSSFYAYSNDTSQVYNAGTPVYVLVPRNDMTQTKTIIGSVNKLGSDYIKTVDSIDKFDIIGNTIATLSSEQGVCSYTENGDALILYDRTAGSSLAEIDITAANTYIKQSEYLVLGGEFRTNLSKEQRYTGNYGLGFDLNFADNTTGETVKRTYLVDVNNMLGKPYEYSKPSEQKIVFNIDGKNFINIDKIYLFCYDFPNIALDKPDDIFVSNLILEAAIPLSETELAGNKLTLIMPQGIYFDSNDSATAARQIKTEVLIDNQVVNEDSNLLKYYWFKENYSINTASLKYHRYGGNGWECLNSYNIVEQDNNTPTLVDWITNQYSYTIVKNSVISRMTDYKCVVVYNNEIVLDKKFTIYNYSSDYVVSIVSDGGVNFSYDNGHPTLTCNVNQEGTYTYKWGVYDSGNNYSDIQTTITSNTQYHTTLNRYNELQTGLKNGTIPLTLTAQQELMQLKYTLEQYETIMRVEDNVIYNLKLNTISGFATFVCYVSSNGNYIGKGSIIIKNDLNDNQDAYSLVINNGNQSFKYNGDGISPASRSLDTPQEIRPLSFILYDEKGNEIPNDKISANNVFWTVPTSDTMIKASAIHGNPISTDDLNETKTYNGYRQFSFEIPTIYDVSKTRNTIWLEVRYKDKIVRGRTEILFLKEGEAGSNGTKFTCRIVPNITNQALAPAYPIVTHNLNAAVGVENPILNYTPATTGVWFKVQLFKNGEEIFSGPVSAQSTEGRNVTIQWEMLKSKYDTSIIDVSNFSVNESTGVFSYIDLSSNSNTLLKNSPSNIVKCTLTYDGIKHIATMPIILTKVNNTSTNKYRVEQAADSGFRYVVYSSDGRIPSYSSALPFALKVYETVDGVEQDISIVTTEATAINYTWFTSGATWNGSSWIAETNLIEKTHSSANLLARNEKDFKPIDFYNGLTVNNGLRCVITRSGNQLAEILLPIHFYLNRYGNAALNEWDGNHIAIDENGGFILSPQIGAGKKENDNSYTGVFMGEVREAGTGNSNIGLFGYNHGEKTIALNAEDGSARFGASGQGQIVIDPGIDSAKLYSDDYEVGYVKPSDMIPAQTKYISGYSYWRKNGNIYTLLKSLEDYIEGYYYNDSFYEDSNHTTTITPIINQKYYDITYKKCYKYTNNNYIELTTYYKNGDTIPSTDYVWAGGNGLEIDLNDPHIRFGSGKFRVDSDGQVYATGFATVVELENGDYDIPGTKNYQVEYPVENVQFETDVNHYPIQSVTRNVTCKCLYKDSYTDDYTVNLINDQGTIITHDASSDGVDINITKSGNVTTISFSASTSRAITNAINSYLFRFTYTPTGDTIDKQFGANLVIRGASLTVKGTYGSLQALLAAVSAHTITPVQGDAYIIDGDLYVYTNTGGGSGTQASDWENVGQFTGEKAKQCIITTTSEVFKSIDGGTTYSPDNIIITPYFQDVNYSSWAYSTDGGANYTTISSTPPTGISINVSTKALTIAKNCTLFNISTLLVFKCLTDDNNIYDTRTIMKIKDGVNGIDGYSIWTTTTAPSTPDYTFTISNLVGPSGKTPSVGEIIIQNNRYQYTITEVVGTTAKATTRVDLKGTNGDNGNNTATINLYGRFAIAPSKPYVESVTYTFSTQTLSSVPTGWSQTVPAIDGDKKLYISSAVAYGNGTTVAIGKDSWTTPAAMAENGANGESPTFVTCGNEVQTLVCDSSGAVTADTLITIPFAGYIGNNRAACSVTYGTLPGSTGEVVLVSNTAATTSADGSLVLKVNATATLGNNNDGIIDLTFTCNSKTFVKKFNWAKALTGTTGYNTATVNLYKRSSSSSSLGTPYSASVNYTFATQSLSTAPSNNWSTTIPDGTDPLYITSAIAYSNTGTDGIATTDWSTPKKIIQNGADGNNTATITLYQRSSSIPSSISSSTTYTFADQSLSPVPTGWSQTIPSGTNPLYATSAIAYSNAATVTILSTKWSSPVKLVENGIDGESVVVDSTTVQYQNANQGTSIPTGTWSSSPSPTEGYYLWTKTTTAYKLATSSTSAGSSVSYSVAYIGDDGDQGVSVVSITPLYYLKTTNGAPLAPTAHVTSTSTSTNVWTIAVPVYDTGATYYSCNEILYDDTSVGTSGYQWTNVVVENGINTAIVLANTATNTSGEAKTIAETTQGQLTTLARRVIDVSNTVTGTGQVTLTNAYAGGLHKLQIWGQINILMPGDNIYPSNSLYPTYLPVLSVDNDEYLLDINYLNYMSENVHDEFIYEEGICKIIRRVGINNGTMYALDNEVIETRNGIKIEVKKTSVIKLKYFANMNYSVQYLLENIYTNSFTTNLDLISKINVSPEQIEISSNKINMNGWISANENFWIDNEGNMGARNGTFSGNIYLPDGGKVVGGDGLLTNLQYTSQSQLYQGLTWVGFEVDGQHSTYIYSDINVDAYIPEDFTITEAYLTLYTCGIVVYDINNQYVGNGICKQLKLCKISSLGSETLIVAPSSGILSVTQPSIIETIDNAWENSTFYTPLTTLGELNVKKSINLKDYLSTGRNLFAIRTNLSIPIYSWSNYEFLLNSGLGKVVLDVIGYKNIKGDK